MKSLIPNFTYEEETDLLCLLQFGIAHTKELLEENSYWEPRVKEFENVIAKFNKEVCNFHYSK